MTGLGRDRSTVTAAPAARLQQSLRLALVHRPRPLSGMQSRLSWWPMGQRGAGVTDVRSSIATQLAAPATTHSAPAMPIVALVNHSLILHPLQSIRQSSMRPVLIDDDRRG